MANLGVQQPTAITVPDPAVARWIMVSIPEHRITVTENGAVVRTIERFSTGRAGHRTPSVKNGRIDPARRFRTHRSSLYKNKAGGGAEMPFSLFFEGACAFHAGDPDVESHGCIHLATDDAEWLFDWVGKSEVGVRVG